MRTFAIGDIHGCYAALMAVVDAAGIMPDDSVITLGDYVDRGSEVRQVLDWLRTRQQTGQQSLSVLDCLRWPRYSACLCASR